MAVQGDFLLWYLDEYERLYECSEDVNHTADLVDAAQEDERVFIDSGVDDLQVAQRHKVVAIVRNFRDARFRPAVLRAYGYRCCATGVALRLVDAAHIIPASEPSSVDDVRNGLALCANYHRAYDNGLLGVLPNGGLKINERFAQKLVDAHLADGLEVFRNSMPPRISCPSQPDLRPSSDWLKQGLLARGWIEDEITQASA